MRSVLAVVTLAVVVAASPICTRAVLAQSTAFTYQGKLTSSGALANGNFEMQFSLFDTPAVGTGIQQGSVVALNPVPASAGLFTVQLDFGANVFDGSARYLQIGLRPSGSAGAYTVLSPRQPITVTPYAIQTINAQQLGGTPAADYIKKDASGRVGIGTAPTTSTFEVAGQDAIKVSGFQPFLTLNDTNSIKRALLQGANGGLAFYTNSTIGGVPAMVIHDDGRIGMGVPQPVSRLEVAGQDAIRAIGFQPFITLHDTGSNQRSIIAGGNGGFGFYTNNTIGGFPAMFLSGSGRLGIGNPTPAHRLAISGGPGWTSDNWGGAIELDNASAIGWRPNVSGNRFGIGQTNGGLVFFATSSDPGTTGSPSVAAMVINDSGHVTQNATSSGLVKAMAYINASGQILRCFNSQLSPSIATVLPCGITVNNFANGGYGLQFGFAVSGRFISLVPYWAGGTLANHGAGFSINGATETIDVRTFVVDDPTNTVNNGFMIVVY